MRNLDSESYSSSRPEVTLCCMPHTAQDTSSPVGRGHTHFPPTTPPPGRDEHVHHHRSALASLLDFFRSRACPWTSMNTPVGVYGRPRVRPWTPMGVPMDVHLDCRPRDNVHGHYPQARPRTCPRSCPRAFKGVHGRPRASKGGSTGVHGRHAKPDELPPRTNESESNEPKDLHTLAQAASTYCRSHRVPRLSDGHSHLK